MIGRLFKSRKPNTQKLLSFGFVFDGDNYIYSAHLADGQMVMTVSISQDGNVRSDVFDVGSGDEYVLHRVPDAEGAFVGRVKAEYEAVLKSVSAECFDADVFKSCQAKAVIDYVKNVYGDGLEYLWQKFPDNAVIRRKDNNKWYAAVLTVSRRKLGFDSDEKAEIIDLRVPPDEIENMVDNQKYFPGYHMNKKHWITVCLDGTVPDEEIYEKIDKSYILAKK